MTVCLTRGVLIGRDADLDRLRRPLHDAMNGSGSPVWIEGEPGIGKSALMESFLAEAAEAGCQVRSASAAEFGCGIPLHVMTDCLNAGLELDDPAGAASAAVSDVMAAAAERLLAVVDHLLARGPLVLAIDDLQWADEASVLLLHRLNRLTYHRPLLMVVACRPVPRRADLVTLKRGLMASRTQTIELTPLPPTAMTRLLLELAGAASAGAGLRRAAEHAGGNPLYLRELVDALTRESRLRWHGDTVELADATAAGGFPRSLAAAISDRLEFLSVETLELLRAAALLGSTFSVTDLGAVVGRSALELTPALEEATAAGVLAESEVHLAFRHTLIRQALYQRPPTGLRLALHLQAARALADAGLAVERIAEQLVAALHRPGSSPVVDGWTVDWLLGAGRTLVCRNPQAAAELLGLAVDYLPSDDPRRESLEAILAPALVLLGRRDEAVRLATKVLTATHDPARAAEMSWTAGWAMTDANQLEAAQTTLSRALRAPGLDEVWSARLHAMVGRAAIADGDLAQAEAAARLALSEADRVGDRVASAAALHVQASLLAHRDDLDGAIVRFGQGLAIAELCDDPESHDLRLRLRQGRAYILLAQERHDEAEAAARELLALAERTAAPPRLACARILVAEAHYHAGRWDDAVAQLTAAGEHESLMIARDRRWLHGLAALIAVHRDDQDTAEAHLDAAPSDGVDMAFAGSLYVPLALALLAERRDQVARATTILTGLLDRTDACPAFHRHVWLPTLLRLAIAADDQALARKVAEPGGEGPAPTGNGTVTRHCTGLLNADHSTLAGAIDGYRAMGRPLQLAHALEDAAVVLAQQGDPRAARAAHTEASDLYTGLGAAWDLLRADTRLRRYGVQRRRGPRRRVATGWDALTPSELTIARLVTDGHANPDIAANLFVSRRTVEVHVSHILTKLGVRSRVEIAREVSRRLADSPDALPDPATAPSVQFRRSA